MIMEETDPIVEELKNKQAETICLNATGLLKEFLTDQRAILMSVLDQPDASSEDIDELLGVNNNQDRQRVVETTRSTLNQYVA